jgi:hypothetical protein
VVTITNRGSAAVRLKAALEMSGRTADGIYAGTCGVGTPRSIRRRSVRATPSNDRVL